MHLAADLQSLGWQVDVLAPHAAGAAKTEILDGVRVERYQYFWPASAQTVCYGGGALINLRENKSNWLKLPFLIVAMFYALFILVARRDYDVIHSHWILPQGLVGGVVGRLTNTPNITTVHGGDLFALQGGFLSSVKRGALVLADLISVNSRHTEKETRKLAGDTKDIRRIPMGVRTDAVNPEMRSTAAELRLRFKRGGDPLIVYAGRLVKEKGVSDLLMAIQLLTVDYPAIHALIIGEGQDRTHLESQADKLGLLQNTTFTGWVPANELPAYLASADIFVAPSRTAPDGWVEAQGLTVLEAMAVGTPVIATRTGGLTDSITDKETGLLVDEREPDAIATGIRLLDENKNLAGKLARNAEANIRLKFSRLASANAFSNEYEKLLGRHS